MIIWTSKVLSVWNAMAQLVCMWGHHMEVLPVLHPSNRPWRDFSFLIQTSVFTWKVVCCWNLEEEFEISLSANHRAGQPGFSPGPRTGIFGWKTRNNNINDNSSLPNPTSYILNGRHGGAKLTKQSFLGENEIGADLDTLTSFVTVQ